MADNTVTIIGNLTKDPEMKFFSSGTAVVNFSVAVNRRWQNRQTQEWEEQTSFFDCVLWSTPGQNLCDSLAKGDRVIVEGRLEQRSWKDDNDQTRSKVEIVVNEVGPSLRWATATVTKNERKGPADNQPSNDSPAPAKPYDPAEDPF